VAGQFGRQIKRAGFDLRQTTSGAGAACGTAVHSSAEYVLGVKISTGELGKLSDGIDAAMASFDTEIADGVEWDATTGSRNAAQKQIKSMAGAYYHGPAQIIRPLEIERQMAADLGDGWMFTGRADVLDVRGVVRDTKTGVVKRPHFAQFGGYSLLCRSEGIFPEVKGAVVDFVKRCKVGAPQAPAEEIIYPVDMCEVEAWNLIQRIKADVGRFMSSGDPREFLANPMSMMCSDRYCRAWGTKFCALGR
jgi:hypothetical protein